MALVIPCHAEHYKATAHALVIPCHAEHYKVTAHALVIPCHAEHHEATAHRTPQGAATEIITVEADRGLSLPAEATSVRIRPRGEFEWSEPLWRKTYAALHSDVSPRRVRYNMSVSVL